MLSNVIQLIFSIIISIFLASCLFHVFNYYSGNWPPGRIIIALFTLMSIAYFVKCALKDSESIYNFSFLTLIFSFLGFFVLSHLFDIQSNNSKNMHVNDIEESDFSAGDVRAGSMSECASKSQDCEAVICGCSWKVIAKKNEEEKEACMKKSSVVKCASIPVKPKVACDHGVCIGK